jgi:hypothetical protein
MSDERGLKDRQEYLEYFEWCKATFGFALLFPDWVIEFKRQKKLKTDANA